MCTLPGLWAYRAVCACTVQKLCYHKGNPGGCREAQDADRKRVYETMRQKLRMLAAAAGCTALLVTGAQAAYTDIPTSHWAYEVVNQAADLGVIQGRGDGTFGLGQQVTRAEFAAMLDRLMGWELTTPAQASYSDVTPSAWYYDEVETARAHGAVTDTGAFRPNAAITREEMAVWLVNALGYQTLAGQNEDLTIQFVDVTDNKGAIAMAYDFGIIEGKSRTSFAPDDPATREEAAAMMMRLYDRAHSQTDWTHGFYAISSWSQHELGGQMDAVSLGWSRLELQNGQAYLNTTHANGNSWCVPDGYEDAINYYKGTGTHMNLAVQMTDQTAANAILPDESQRASAIAQLIQEVNDLGVDGVTVDFEGLKGDSLKNGLTAFVQELKTALGGKQVYVCVHPVLKSGGAYYDAYDYRALGEAADKVILMAHDYAASSMDQTTADGGFTTTPVSPFEEVYYALHMATDDQTGVRDTSKLVLGLSVSNTAGWTLQNGKVVNLTANHPAMDTILRRMGQSDTRIAYSDTYRNPYMTYTDDDGNTNILWYEDAQSLTDKIELARMFGVNQVSVWRLGAIPTDARWDLWSALTD